MKLLKILTSPAGGLWCYCDLSCSPSAQISAGGSLQNIQNIQKKSYDWGVPNQKHLISDTELDLFWEEPHNSFSLPCGDGKSDVRLRSWQEIAVNGVAWSGLIGNISVWPYWSLTLVILVFGQMPNQKLDSTTKVELFGDCLLLWLQETSLETRLKLDCRLR